MAKNTIKEKQPHQLDSEDDDDQKSLISYTDKKEFDNSQIDIDYKQEHNSKKQFAKKAIDVNNSIYAFKQQSMNAEFRSSIWLLSVHGWFFKSNPALKSYINKQMRCDFITLYKREYIDKFIKEPKKQSKKK